MHSPDFSSNPVPLIPWQNIQLGDLIINGSFGDIYKGSYGAREVAVKILQSKNLLPHLMQDFYYESKTMWECKFNNIVELYGFCAEAENVSIIMEYMSRGSLNDLLYDVNQPLTEELKWSLAIGIAEGLSYLHSKNILHRRLKSSNILLNEKGEPKISGFGFLTFRLETATSNTLESKQEIDVVRWWAPELFKRGAASSKASDVYSYGMILWEIISRKLPFNQALDELTVISWLKRGVKENIPDSCPDIWKEIINDCWAGPESRPDMASIAIKLRNSFAAIKSDTHLDGAPQRLLFVATKPIVPVSQIISPQLLSQFFDHVGFGEQEEAEEMLKKDIKLAIMQGDLTDCSGRTWRKITALQYSVLVLDYQMWSMLLKYIDEPQKCSQLQDININASLSKEGWIIKPIAATKWPTVDLAKLIETMSVYIKNYESWTFEQIGNYWCQQIGIAQLKLPAHVINEYSHPGRSLYPCPEWGNKEERLPRTAVRGWCVARQGKYNLGKDFAWLRACREDRVYVLGGHPSYGGYLGPVCYDYIAMKELLRVRVEQAAILLIHEPQNQPVNQPRINV